MEINKYNKKLFFILLIPLGMLLSIIASKYPNIVEAYYSTGIYKPIGIVLSRITGVIPISAGELLLIFTIIFAAWRIMLLIIKISRKADSRWHLLFNFILSMLTAASIIYFSFIIFWGLNYYRLPFSTISKLEIIPSTTSELAELCENLVDRANLLRSSIEEDSGGVAKLSGNYRNIFKRASLGYENASRLYPALEGKYGSPKGVLMSKLMSYTGITGVYFPFTGEANVNVSVPGFDIPATACHEMAHQRGFAREDEANYIAYLTCKLHPDIDFQYSGTLLALIHSTNALYLADRDAFNDIRSKYGEGLNRDLRSLNYYWSQFEGPISDVSDKINDTYLKANNQHDGVHSYGRMVDLLLAEHRSTSR